MCKDSRPSVFKVSQVPLGGTKIYASKRAAVASVNRGADEVTLRAMAD